MAQNDNIKVNTHPAPIIGNCLSCQGMVRIPANSSVKAEVRCPHCDNKFPLAEILEQAVPALEVVESEPVIDTGDGEQPKFVIPSQLVKGAKHRRGRRSRRSRESFQQIEMPSGDHEPGKQGGSKFSTGNGATMLADIPSLTTVDANEDRSKSSRRDRESSSRSKRGRRSRKAKEQASPWVEVVKIVLGALLAIPIAYLLVFWVFRLDPFQVGPTVSKVAPFLVPAEFHAEVEPEGLAVDSDDEETEGKKPQSSGPLVVDPSSGGLALPKIDPELISPARET